MNKLEESLKFFNKISFRGPLALIIIIGSFGFLFALLFKPIPAENKDNISQAQGFVLALAAGVVGWYFGSSKKEADAEKADKMHQMLSTQHTESTTTTTTPGNDLLTLPEYADNEAAKAAGLMPGDTYRNGNEKKAVV